MRGSDSAEISVVAIFALLTPWAIRLLNQAAYPTDLFSPSSMQYQAR
jgi:hypothetical protein